MRLHRHRRTLAATTVLAAALITGACGTSFNAQTSQQYQAGVGTDLRDGDVQVFGATLVTGEDGSATLSATVINKSDVDQRLTNATLVDADGNSYQLDSADSDDLVIIPNEARALGQADDTDQARGSKVYTTTGIEDFGRYYTLTLNFSEAGEVSMDVPAVARSSVYADVALPPGADAAENDKEPGSQVPEAEEGSSAH